MHKVLFIFLSLLTTLSAVEDVRIAKILDANLFLLEDGRKIKLAYVECPSLDSADSLNVFLARRIVDYAQKNILRVPLAMETVRDETKEKDVLAVQLYRKFPLETLHINLFYLEKGFGKYIPVAQQKYDQEFTKAEKAAQKAQKGLWDNALLQAKVPFRQTRMTILAGYANFTDGPDDQSRVYGMSLDLETEDYRKNGFELSLDLLSSKEQGVAPCDGPPLPYSESYYGGRISISGFFNWTYFGFRTGLFFLGYNGGYCSEMPLLLVRPSLGIKFGFLEYLYINIDYMDDLMYSPLNLGISWSPDAVPLEIWLGYMPDGILNIPEEWKRIGLKLLYRMNKRLSLNSQFFYGPKSNYSAMRLGVTLTL